MADFPYLKFSEALNTGLAFNPLTATIGYVLVNETGGGTTYTPNEDTDEFLAAIPVGARMATGTLANVTRTNNLTTKRSVVNADNASLGSVSGAKVDAVVFFIDTGSAATSRLICHYTSWTGLPFVPTGGPLAVNMPVSNDKIFSIGKP